MLRGVTFYIEIPVATLISFAGTWNGNHFVLRADKEFRLVPLKREAPRD
jgi:hypothetical protein